MFKSYHEPEIEAIIGCKLLDSFSLQETMIGCEQFLAKLDYLSNWSVIKNNLEEMKL